MSPSDFEIDRKIGKRKDKRKFIFSSDSHDENHAILYIQVQPVYNKNSSTNKSYEKISRQIVAKISRHRQTYLLPLAVLNIFKSIIFKHDISKSIVIRCYFIQIIPFLFLLLEPNLIIPFRLLYHRNNLHMQFVPYPIGLS